MCFWVEHFEIYTDFLHICDYSIFGNKSALIRGVFSGYIIEEVDVLPPELCSDSEKGFTIVGEYPHGEGNVYPTDLGAQYPPEVNENPLEDVEYLSGRAQYPPGGVEYLLEAGNLNSMSCEAEDVIRDTFKMEEIDYSSSGDEGCEGCEDAEVKQQSDESDYSITEHSQPTGTCLMYEAREDVAVTSLQSRMLPGEMTPHYNFNADVDINKDVFDPLAKLSQTLSPQMSSLFPATNGLNFLPFQIWQTQLQRSEMFGQAGLPGFPNPNLLYPNPGYSALPISQPNPLHCTLDNMMSYEAAPSGMADHKTPTAGEMGLSPDVSNVDVVN